MALRRGRIGLWSAVWLCCPAAAWAAPLERFETVAGVEARLSGDARLRYEGASDEARPERGEALTFRARVGLEAALGPRASILAEFEGAGRLAGEFDDLVGAPTPQAVIADPEFAELNRFHLRSWLTDDIEATIGRQRLSFDDERFIGRVAFRQNEQTYDAVSLAARLPRGATLDAVYFRRANRIISARSEFGRFVGDSYLLGASTSTPLGRVGVFHYALDLETGPRGARDAAASSQTTGFRLDGRRRLGRAQLNWRAAYARQRDFAGAPAEYGADYWLGAADIAGERFSVGGRFEVLGADDVGAATNAPAFQTPLGTLHAFQGAADVFLITPEEGVQERSVSAAWRLGRLGPLRGVRVFANQLWFRSADGEIDYGREIDLGAGGRINGALVSMKWAAYSADEFGADVRRLWLTVERAF